MRGNSASPAVTTKSRGTHHSCSRGNTQKDGRAYGTLPQPLGGVGILQQGVGHDERGKTAVPQNVEPIRALQPGAKQATWREHARKGQQPRDNDERREEISA